MATVFTQIEKYRKKKKLPELSHNEVTELGKRTIEAYIKVKPKNIPIHRKPQIEPTGTYLVLEYPNKFAPEIDKIIGEYYDSIQPIQPKIRKRIPARKPLNY